MKKIFVLWLLAFLAFFPACTYQQKGAAIGGAAGGVTGYLLSQDQKDSTQVAAVMAGTVIGGLIGGTIGTYMDKSDQKRVKKALRQVPKNKSRSWTNSKTGNRFTIKPISDIDKDSKGRSYRKATLFARKKGSDKMETTTKKMYL